MSRIEWTDETWNPVVGCTPVSPGCLNCYAAAMAVRLQGNEKVKEYRPREGKKGNRTDGTDGTDGTKTIRIAEMRAGRAVFTGDVRTVAERLTDPLHWREPRRVFVNSMSDLFHEDVPFEFVDRVFAVMALSPRHTFQVLTKRPGRMAEYFESSRGETMVQGRVLAQMYKIVVGQKRTPEALAYEAAHRAYHADYSRGEFWPLPNVWLGASVENQATAEERIPHLLKCPAAVRFLSVEPLLGVVNIGLAMCTCPWPADAMRTRHLMDCPSDTRRPDDQRMWARLQWVIVGGESGPKARACEIDWIRGVVKQCRGAGVPVFVKQLGGKPVDGMCGCDEPPGTKYPPEAWLNLKDSKGGDWHEWPVDLRVREWPEPQMCADKR